jgi:hypothetical protein
MSEYNKDNSRGVGPSGGGMVQGEMVDKKETETDRQAERTALIECCVRFGGIMIIRRRRNGTASK